MGGRSNRYEYSSSKHGKKSSRYEHGRSRSERSKSDVKGEHKKTKIGATSHFSDLDSVKITMEKTPLCIFTWIILTILLTCLGLIILLYFTTDNLTHSSSTSWVLDGSDLDAIEDRELVIEYSNLFGSLYIKEHTQGGEYIEIWREDTGNKNYLSMPEPELVLTDTTATLRLSGPSIWEFIKAAARKAEYTIYVPDSYAQLKEISINALNGITVIDLPTAETVEKLELKAYFDLSNVIGAAQIMNGSFDTIDAYTLKPHLCIGVGSDSPNYDFCFAGVVRDMRVTTGVRVNHLNYSSFNGNFFGHNMQLVSGSTQDEVNDCSWSASTLNGRVHYTWDQDSKSYNFALPRSISGSVTTTSWKLFTEYIVLIEGPDGLFDGYEVTSGNVYPTTALDEETNCIQDCDLTNHDDEDVDEQGIVLPPNPYPLDSREIYTHALIGSVFIRNLE